MHQLMCHHYPKVNMKAYKARIFSYLLILKNLIVSMCSSVIENWLVYNCIHSIAEFLV